MAGMPVALGSKEEGWGLSPGHSGDAAPGGGAGGAPVPRPQRGPGARPWGLGRRRRVRLRRRPGVSGMPRGWRRLPSPRPSRRTPVSAQDVQPDAAAAAAAAMLATASASPKDPLAGWLLDALASGGSSGPFPPSGPRAARGRGCLSPLRLSRRRSRPPPSASLVSAFAAGAQTAWQETMRREALPAVSLAPPWKQGRWQWGPGRGSRGGSRQGERTLLPRSSGRMPGLACKASRLWGWALEMSSWAARPRGCARRGQAPWVLPRGALCSPGHLSSLRSGAEPRLLGLPGPSSFLPGSMELGRCRESRRLQCSLSRRPLLPWVEVEPQLPGGTALADGRRGRPWEARLWAVVRPVSAFLSSAFASHGGDSSASRSWGLCPTGGGGSHRPKAQPAGDSAADWQPPVAAPSVWGSGDSSLGTL